MRILLYKAVTIMENGDEAQHRMFFYPALIKCIGIESDDENMKCGTYKNICSAKNSFRKHNGKGIPWTKINDINQIRKELRNK